MVSRRSSLYRTFLCLPLFWKASLAFAEPVCEWPVGIEKCSGCPPINPADLTSGPGGYGFGPDGLPCFGDTGPYWDPGPWSNGNPSNGNPSNGNPSNGNPGSVRPPTASAPTATTSGGPLGPSGSPGRRVFYLTVTWETRAPDGNAREIFVINGQFPGPKLEINQGDDVEIHLLNQSPFNTTIHFHGGFLTLSSQSVAVVQTDYFLKESNNSVPPGPTAYPESLSEVFGLERCSLTDGEQLNMVPIGIIHTKRHKSTMASLAPS